MGTSCLMKFASFLLTDYPNEAAANVALKTVREWLQTVDLSKVFLCFFMLRITFKCVILNLQIIHALQFD